MPILGNPKARQNSKPGQHFPHTIPSQNQVRISQQHHGKEDQGQQTHDHRQHCHRRLRRHRTNSGTTSDTFLP